MAPSLEGWGSELPALSLSGAVQEGSFTDGNGLSSLSIQDLRVRNGAIDCNQNSSRTSILTDSDHGFAKSKSIERLRRDISVPSFSLPSTRASSRTLQNLTMNSRKKIPGTLSILTGAAARLRSKSETSLLKIELIGENEIHDQLAALNGVEDRSSAKMLSKSSDAYMHSPTLNSGVLRPQALVPLQGDRVISAGAASPSSF